MFCSSNDKNTHQEEEEDAENLFLEAVSQELSVKEAIGKPLNSNKLTSIANKMFIVNMDEELFKAMLKNITYLRTFPT